MTTSKSIASIHDKIRARFPQLEQDQFGNERVYLNSGAGSLMVDSAMSASYEASRSLNPMPGAVTPGEKATAEFHNRVRRIAADFLNAAGAEEISFHLSATNALFNLAVAMRAWSPDDGNLVVTDLDHMANVSPWEGVWGRGRGCEVRRARVTPEGTLDIDHLLDLVDGRTRIVAVTMASNGFGTIVPIHQLVGLIRQRSPALVCVDAVHHALHGPIDVQGLDVDFLVFSGYKVFGPMLGVLYGKKALLDKLDPYRVETNKNETPFKYEQGMLNNANLAGLEAALDYLLWLEAELFGTTSGAEARRPRFQRVMEAIEDYERGLSRAVLQGFGRFDSKRFRCHGLTDPSRCEERDPTFAFEVKGLAPADIKRRLWEESSVQIADGNHYSAAVFRHLGRSALCRASFAHYDDAKTARTFLGALEPLVECKS